MPWIAVPALLLGLRDRVDRGRLLWGFTLGTAGSTGVSFLTDVEGAQASHNVWALLGGVIFNVANLLLVAAIEIAGLAVAFPVGIGLALVIGAGSSYILAPHGNPAMLFGGIALVVGAIVCDAVAYRLREQEHQATSRRGVGISLIAGLLMGTFYPFVSRAMTGADAPGPYATSFFFVIGVAALRHSVQLSLNAQAARCPEPRIHGGFYSSSRPVAWVGNIGRRDLVHCRGLQLCRIPSPHCWARGFLLHWARGHDGFRRVGCLHLA